MVRQLRLYLRNDKMTGISNVLIIDDQFEETVKLRESFDRHGISYLYINPTELTDDYHLSFIPDIVCCDIKLFNGNDNDNYTKICDILTQLLPENAFYVFVAWTSNKNLFDALKAKMKQDQYLKSSRQPVESFCWTKSRCTYEILEKKFKGIKPSTQLLFYWKSIIRQSATGTANQLVELSKKNRTDLKRILTSLAINEVGKHIDTSKHLAITGQLHSLLLDTSNKAIMSDKIYNMLCSKSIDKKRQNVNNKISSTLNTALFVDPSCDNLEHIPAGDFRELNVRAYKKVLQYTGQEEGQLKEQKKKLFEQYFCNSGKSQKAAIEEAMRNSKLCLLDITAGCDCAQNKEGFHKAVITYLVPKLPTLKLRDKKTRPAIPDSVNVKNFSLNNGEYLMIIDAKYLMGLKQNELSMISTRLFRIREHMLNSIRQNVYAYNSRIGTSTF